ncbi:response regulator [Kitasatospora sp. NPDC048540]|uniref:response regulator n=1 Tax=unclassified Kitasatospora TaxID=2633591 RepID=UPI00068D8F50|nr:response regulator [Kitasatospora sp. MBT63]
MTTGKDRILVVDDDRTNRMMITYRLEVSGLLTDTAENGNIALEKLRREQFDVVLLDIVMPELDGYATLEHMRADSALRDIPVVMMSALGEMDSVIRCLELGAVDYLPKPLDSLLLASRVNAILLKARLEHLEEEREEELGKLASAVAAARLDSPAFHELTAFFDYPGSFGRLAREIAQALRAQ